MDHESNSTNPIKLDDNLAPKVIQYHTATATTQAQTPPSETLSQQITSPQAQTPTDPYAGKPAFTDLTTALRYVYDTLQASMLNNYYSLVGDTARFVKAQDAVPGTIEIAIFNSRLTPEVRATLILWGFGETDFKDYFGTVGNVPVCFRRVEPTPYFINPDVVFFDVDEYRIPNPYLEYVERLT